jgi:hypothetical protein
MASTSRLLPTSDSPSLNAGPASPRLFARSSRAKLAIRIANNVCGLLVLLTSLVALHGLSQDPNQIKFSNWEWGQIDNPEGTSTVIVYANLWGQVSNTNTSLGKVDKSSTKAWSSAPCNVRKDLFIGMNVRFCNAYQSRGTYAAFSVLSVIFAGLTLAVSLVSLRKPLPVILTSNIALNALTFLLLLILWAMWYSNVWGGTIYLEITSYGNIAFNPGTGFQSAVASCFLALANVLISYALYFSATGKSNVGSNVDLAGLGHRRGDATAAAGWDPASRAQP